MRKFRPYPLYKIYLEDKVFVNDNLELKIGYLNINDLTAEFHAEYLNLDKNLLNLDLLALADTRLGNEISQQNLANKLDNFKILKRFDVSDGIKHMGILLLLSKNTNVNALIPEDLIESFEESKMMQKGTNEGKKMSFVQGNVLWIREHFIKICFVYFREKPTQKDLLLGSKHWKGCDVIMGDLNLKQNIPADEKLLKFVCGDNYTLALNEMTTVYGQPDHILVSKTIKMKYFTTSYHNFISDHKSFVIRIGLKQNTYDTSFVQKINFDSEKHKKKLKASKELPTNQTETKNRNQPEKKESYANMEKVDGSSWLDDTLLNEAEKKTETKNRSQPEKKESYVNIEKLDG